MLRLRTVVVGLVHALPLLLVVVLGEPFYQRRDHLDQEKYLDQTRNINVVRDLTDAEFVLSKYGYLLCRVPRRKREAGSLFHSRRNPRRMAASAMGSADHGHLWSRLEEGLDSCEKAEVQKAILNYQSTYNLPLTGELDKETMSLMSTSRCGNKDSAKEPTLDPAGFLEEGRGDAAALPSAISPLEQQSDDSVDSGENGGSDTSQDTDNSQTSHRLWRRSASRGRNGKLFSVLSGRRKPQQPRPLSAHREFLREFIQNENLKAQSSGRRSKRSVNKRWRSRLLRRYTPGERRKRSIHVWMTKEHQKRDPSLLFNRKVVRWRLLDTGLSTRIPLYDQRATITLAFRMWSEVIPLRFVEDHDSDIHSVDIEIAFGKGSHQNCEHDFDGNGGEIAHSWNIGDMHFDDDESFRSIGSANADGIYLLRVAVHEIGHVLGLAHTNKSHSIMFAIYRGAQVAEFELSRDDRKDIQEIYGVCKGSFNTVFDWVRRDPNNEFVYNSYFFRDNHYWMYENHANRTRYGDPLYIAREWSGVPNEIDGYVHLWFFNGGTEWDEAFFFKGENYYRYDSTNDTVVEGWPRLISEDFGPKDGETTGVPSHLDAVFFDIRDRNLYFFKDEDVYVYDPTLPAEEKGCCVRTTSLQTEFPPADGQRPLPANLDAVYYSYRDKMQYFIKGEDFWRNKLFDPRQRRTHNSVEYMGKWYDKWFDICDVAVMNQH